MVFVSKFSTVLSAKDLNPCISSVLKNIYISVLGTIFSRKLYRSGESEYLINGQKSRLKDIQELLMGTGLGRDGYSIIGQGRVAEIVNSRGTQRREIFASLILLFPFPLLPTTAVVLVSKFSTVLSAKDLNPGGYHGAAERSARR